MTTARDRLVEAALTYEERRQTHEVVAADPDVSPEDKFAAKHRADMGEIVLLIRAAMVLKQALH